MLNVGLTGGLASGKTFIAHTLERLGCALIHADELGHAVLMPDGEAYAEVVREFGEAIVAADGRIDRRKLAAQVFEHPERLATLNALVHPHVRARAASIAERFCKANPGAIVVTEAAILVETGSYKNFDRLIVAFCAPEQQIERAMHRDGISRQEAEARLARQLPLAEKLKVANFVIDTSGTKEDTVAQTERVYEELRRAEV